MIFQRYIIWFFGGFITLSLLYVMAFNALVWNGLHVQNMAFAVLYDYQDVKARTSKAETIFVGDSSLGNAINAALYSELSGRDVENFALTGKFGYRGSLEMIRHVHARNKNLRRVIVMQTPDMMKRPPALEYRPPELYFRRDNFPGFDLTVYNFSALVRLVSALKDRRWDIEENTQQIENDYIRQGPPKDASLTYGGLRSGDINPAKARYLKEIADYCDQYGLECLYAHAPVVEDICLNSTGYLESVNAIIRQSGLKLANEAPLCIPKDKLGDSSDHVRPEYKDDYTRAYYEALK